MDCVKSKAGQERFQSLANAFYRGADCCVLVYDITMPSSFLSLQMWRDEFLRHQIDLGSSSFPFLVIGNKTDLADDRKVSTQHVSEWCKMNGLHFVETSTKDGRNVEKAFEKIVHETIENNDGFDYLEPHFYKNPMLNINLDNNILNSEKNEDSDNYFYYNCSC